jgi:hypothetical protein
MPGLSSRRASSLPGPPPGPHIHGVGQRRQRAAETAHEWLDASDKAGIRPDAKAEVEQIGESPEPDDLLGTQCASDPDYRVEVVERGTNRPGRRAAGPADSALD